ncbi:L,D-transpeptidase [Rhizobium sp. NFR07]|uniref:L,D-transpeptidase n=1 Tax=Rhizobium sp. NFR07 TaxID=1566262 RepID=UPI000B822AD6|nr:L,D-transpeptidase [Rhizobium sp. NFR07]
MQYHSISRRGFLLSSLAAPAILTGCTTPQASMSPGVAPGPAGAPLAYSPDPELEARYAAFEDGGFLVPAVPYQKMDPAFLRQRVSDPTGEAPGTVVVDTPGRFLYLVEPDGMAMRYGVGIGREGFAWEGDGVIHWRQPWPRWKPPGEMIARQPDLERYSVANGGMDPGLMNPLGARALYIFQNRQDTLYRLHGSPEWNSIGRSVSSGCVRLVNHDIVDLYERIPHHARIVVYQTPIAGTA